MDLAGREVEGLGPAGDIVVCSTGTMPSALGMRYHEIDAALEAAEVIPARDLEVVLHPDWRPGLPPRSKQPDPPGTSGTLTSGEIVSRLREAMARTGARIRSIHANRDLGTFLGARDSGTRRIAAELLEETIGIAREVGAGIIVLHPWNSWAGAVDLEHIAVPIIEASRSSEAVLTVENIPLSAPEWSQAEAMVGLADLLPDAVGFTLDLSWSSMYGNFDELLVLLSRVKNVHVQGRLMTGDDREWLHPRAGNMDLDASIRRLCRLGYDGQWTLELNRPRSPTDFRRGIKHLQTLIDSTDDKGGMLHEH